MNSSKDAKEVGNREHHTHSGICVAFRLPFAAEKECRVFISFQIRSYLKWSIEMKGRVAATQSSNAAGKTNLKTKRGAPTISKSSATRATSKSTNSTGINQSSNSRGCSRGCSGASWYQAANWLRWSRNNKWLCRAPGRWQGLQTNP